MMTDQRHDGEAGADVQQTGQRERPEVSRKTRREWRRDPEEHRSERAAEHGSATHRRLVLPSRQVWSLERSACGQPSAMVTTQTTMQYGHSASMRYRLWKMSQCTKMTPVAVPTYSPIQNQCGRVAPPTSTTPTVTMTANPATPRIGLGNPNASA